MLKNFKILFLCFIGVTFATTENVFAEDFPPGLRQGNKVVLEPLPDYPPPLSRAEMETELKKVFARKKALDKKFWFLEEQAQAHERTITHLWDSLRYSENQLQELSHFPVKEIQIPLSLEVQVLEWGIEQRSTRLPGRSLDQAGYTEWLKGLSSAGFQLIQSEWHHAQFNADDNSKRSVFNVKYFVLNEVTGHRHLVKCRLIIDWKAKQIGSYFLPLKVIVEDVLIYSLKGEAAFKPFPVKGAPSDGEPVYGGGHCIRYQ